MSSSAMNWAISLFYLAYLIFEIPSTLLLRFLGPTRYLSLSLILWGSVTVGMAFVKNSQQLLIVRFLLGMVQSGFFTGTIIYFSLWYCKKEQIMRFSILFGAVCTAGVLDGILAYGIRHMEDIGGLKNWRWLFLLEGLPIIPLGVMTYLFLGSIPDTVQWLDNCEKQLLTNLLREDAGNVAVYVSTCVACCGTISAFPLLLAWLTNNVGGHTKRAMAVGFLVGIGQIGGVLAPQMSNCSYQTSNCNHLSFHCLSGELLWGQLHCICEGYYNRLHNQYDIPQSIPEPLKGGTILRRSYQYRCRAAKGDWQAKLYRTRLTLKSESFNSGYIIYNIHPNPVEILRRCAAVGIDNSNSDDDYSLKRLFGGRVMIIDSNSAMNIIQQLKSNPTVLDQSPEKVFIQIRNESNNRVGLHLSIPNTEYEFAWLVFNSDQPNSELIGIVYDGSYTLLEGQIILDQEDVVSWNEYESKRQEQARIEADLWKKFQSDAEQQDDADIRTIMNNRGNKTVEQLANEFIAQGFTFHNSTEIVLKYSEEYKDFQSVVDTIQKKLAERTDNNNLFGQSAGITET
ncbi:unnamed protein product [Rotaria sordida]|uniref:Uncharacterized protein n=2 Tax=Rotaria sordida TaxID=392033 RepID=A0A814HFQ9_9BILA|nr:unnamed protein product [Rotaria sordida]